MEPIRAASRRDVGKRGLRHRRLGTLWPERSSDTRASGIIAPPSAWRWWTAPRSRKSSSKAFLPAYDQICTHAARMRIGPRRAHRAADHPRADRGGIHAPEMHSDSPEVIYAHTPGLKVVMPSSPYDAKVCSSARSAIPIRDLLRTQAHLSRVPRRSA